MNIELKKTEKLVSAVYLLTSFFNDLEPMKWRLRDLGGELVQSREPRSIIQEIVSLLNISKNAGLISEMNYNIIHKEFSNFLAQDQTLPELLKPSREDLYEVSTQEEKKVSYLPDVITKDAPQKFEHRVTSIKDKIIKDISEQPEGTVALKKNNRQSVIFGLLKKKGEIMIKDVTPMIPGVSEKTIQRELLSLVKQGILRKEGEKRWSKYSFA